MRTPRIFLATVLLLAGLSTSSLTVATSAGAACVPSGWTVGSAAAFQSISPAYTNGFGSGQQIKFKVLSGYNISKFNSNCTTSRATMGTANQYQLRNPLTSLNWGSWKYMTTGQANACGPHRIAPGAWGCVYGQGAWANWPI